MSVGLVLGGGGPVGIAWEIGVLRGLTHSGHDLADVSVTVGTSAGSVVGSRLATGADLDQLVAEQQTAVASPLLAGAAGDEPPPPPDMDRVIKIFSLLGSSGAMTTGLARQAGQMALEAPTPPEERWVANFHRLLDGVEWTSADLRITTVDCDSGERRIFTRDDGIELARVVAASCAVPGMFPPVTIGGRRYTDGGVWSPSNADVLIGSGVDTGLFIGPMGASGEGLPPSLDRERIALAEAGIPLVIIQPGREFTERIGINLMDASLRGVAVDIGLADGIAAAERARVGR